MIMATMNKQIKVSALLRNLVVVYFSNLLGSLIIDVLIFYSGNLDYTGGALGAYTIKVALGKVNIAPGKAIVSGILCNFLVCMAIGGFEHIVANMFYIPTGILAASNPDYVAKAQELYSITSEQLSALDLSGLIHNFIPVTIGNILGGMVFIGCTLYFIHYGSEKKERK